MWIIGRKQDFSFAFVELDSTHEYITVVVVWLFYSNFQAHKAERLGAIK